MIDFHDNLCGRHHFWRTTAYKILRFGYLWPTLFTNVCAKIRAGDKCHKLLGKQQLKYFPMKPIVYLVISSNGDYILLKKFIELQVVNIVGF
jgi:hypothetical protein